MKSNQRRTAVAVGLFAFSLMGASPVLAQPARGQPPAQRGGAPGQDTPQILIATFASSPTQQLGVEVADEIRSRFQGEHSAKELYVVTKTNIDNALRQSGYKPDSSLSASDLVELAKITHGDYVLDGKVTKTGNVLHTETRILLKQGQQTLTQPLPNVDGKDAGDVAKQVEKNTTEALKQMVPYRACINDLRAQKYDQAVKDGGLAIAAYPKSSLARICQLEAFSNLKQNDSVIAVGLAILAADSTSTQALGRVVDAYTAKGDKQNAMRYMIVMFRRDPTNSGLIKTLIQELVNAGSYDQALPIIDTVLVQNPGDPEMLTTKWKVYLAAKRWKPAMVAGEELFKVAPPATDSAAMDYYNRMIGAAQGDSNNVKIIEYASKAGQKFPKDVSFQNILAQSYRKAGQLQEALRAATRATELDPKNTAAWYLAALTAKDLTLADTAAAIAQRGIAAGADKPALEPFLLGPVTAAVNKANASKDRGDWEAALAASQKLDATAASPATKFFVGLSAFQVGYLALQNAQETAKGVPAGAAGKEARAKACAETKILEDMWVLAQTSIVPGGAFNKESAGQVMSAIQQYNDVIPQMKKAYCTGK